MRNEQGSKWRLRAVAATLLALTLAGCGGGGSDSGAATKTSSTGTISATGGNSGAAALSLQAPAGVELSIPAETLFTDISGNAVSGVITTTVSYSTAAADLPAAAATVPAGSTLLAFADVELTGAGATPVKSFSKPVAVTFKVPAGAAAAGDPLVLYSFDGGSGGWKFAGTEIVDAEGKVSTGITHLSVWGLYKSVNPPPVKPSGLNGASGDAQATLTWSEVAGASSYNVYCATSAGVATDGTPTVSGALSGQAVTGLANGATYYFVVTAVNASGQSVASNEISVTPMPPLPARIQGTSVTGGDGKFSVSWNPVSGATSYNIYYATAAGVTKTNSVKVSGVTSPAAVTGLENGRTYYVVMTAQNIAGEGPLSSEKQVTPAAAPQPPGETTGVALTAGAGQVTVSWRDIVVGAASYNVYYLQSAAAPAAATVRASGTRLSAAASPLVVSGLTSGSSYWFVVTAANAAGEGAGQTNPKKAVPL